MRSEPGENPTVTERLSRWAKSLINRTSSSPSDQNRRETTSRNTFSSAVSAERAKDEPGFGGDATEQLRVRRGLNLEDPLFQSRVELQEMSQIIADLDRKIESLETIARKWKNEGGGIDRRA